MTTDTIYDHPLYYDILFDWDRSAEAVFYNRIFELNGVSDNEHILEVACGTGQIAKRLARINRSVTGMDISEDMLAFLNDSSVAEGLTVRTIQADMTTFSDDNIYGAAFNPMSSFRLLHSDGQAEAHLASMAASLRIGGVYVLDLDFCERIDGPSITTEESWEMNRAGVSVHGTNDVIYVDDNGNKLELQWGAEGHLRKYTVATFIDRVKAVESFEIHSWHPEAGRAGEDGASIFEADNPVTSIHAGRAMVVLCRV